jgi:sulfur-oxidizing protein SoxX
MRPRSSAETENDMKTRTVMALAALGAIAAGCASMEEQYREKALASMKISFKESGQAKLDRLDQDAMQKACSEYPGGVGMPKELSAKLEKEQQALVRYPPDGKLLGDWKAGERIAQTGVGKQYSDDPQVPSGGNCYACHQLTKEEVSYGTIGPSLNNFAKLRGYTPEMQKYAYGKVYNSQAFSVCSSMPRFGHSNILTEQQMKDVTALLMDPNSPVNK